ncbi:hypothetical protein [Leptospira licerasiae]|uniref:Uncharacterized protein n=1 Tax=Leptospira licerasiae str. MMD4847 TaxID=1049971 RepID=A0ABN0H992_9LEPT|nr:hypothetical protein [Leptospira licerasiae]EIE01428.1 hypothetical protein LEP1GSC185_3941 [Leptospira licerasiae serovar Varillal str. VAR 010]EJZ42292.1 hypothetical protein LEP1GSC178_0010 [Leptospira licerasiae str. MMD4847]
MNILSPNRKIILKASLEGKSLTFDAELAVPRVRIDIDLAVGRRLGGVSLESIPSTTLGYIYAIQTLDQVVKSLPEDFPEIRTFEEIDDQNFVIELFNDYDKQDRAFQAELKKNNNPNRTRGSRDNSRSLSTERIRDNSGRDEQGESIFLPEEVSTRSDSESRLPEIQKKDQSDSHKKANSSDASERVPIGYKPFDGTYPGRTRRVFRRNATEGG